VEIISDFSDLIIFNVKAADVARTRGRGTVAILAGAVAGAGFHIYVIFLLLAGEILVIQPKNALFQSISQHRGHAYDTAK
jgi:hypothetical protein